MSEAEEPPPDPPPTVVVFDCECDRLFDRTKRDRSKPAELHRAEQLVLDGVGARRGGAAPLRRYCRFLHFALFCGGVLVYCQRRIGYFVIQIALDAVQAGGDAG